MSDENGNIGPAPTSGGGLRMVVVMGGVGLIASVILVATYKATEPYIEENRQAYLERAILDVIPRATTFVAFELRDGSVVPAEGEAGLYAGFDGDSVLAGVAIEARGQGYQDVIRLLYGYDPECECIVGMKVLESKETPGLGDKIEKDERFRSNFDSLDARTAEGEEELQHPIEMVKSGSKQNAWEIEAITGATVSSRAITSIIGTSAAKIVPVVNRQRESFRVQP